MKKLAVISSLAILLSGCASESLDLSKGSSTGVVGVNVEPTLAPTAVPTLAPTVTPTVAPTVTPTKGSFTEADLYVDLGTVGLSTMSNIKDLKLVTDWSKHEKFSNGRVKLDTYEGNIIFRWGYPATNPLYTLTIQDKVSNGAVNISRIALAEEATTRKGLKAKDSYEKLIDLYGKPTKDEKEMGSLSIAYYFIGDHAMLVSYDTGTHLIYDISFTNKLELDKLVVNRSDMPDSDQLPPTAERDANASFLGIPEIERLHTFLANFPTDLASFNNVYWFDPMDTYIKRNSKLWVDYEQDMKKYANDKAVIGVKQVVTDINLAERFVTVKETRQVTSPKFDPNRKTETTTKTIKYILAPDQLKFIDHQILD